MSLLENPITVAQAIDARRSVRTYTARTLDGATVRALSAAVCAATAVDEEPWASPLPLRKESPITAWQ
jgi:hypothetical protein